MRFLLSAITLLFTLAGSLRATDLPTLKTALPDVTATQGSAVPAVNLQNFFEVADIHGQVVQLRTTSGRVNLEMLPAAAPLSVANFLTYVNGSRYANTVVHRSDAGLGVIQGGGYALPLPALARIAANSPIALEYNLPNARGTIAMARTSVLNSATTEWFINTKDNTTILGQANGGGYAVFGRVTGSGMTVVDAIHALPVFDRRSEFAAAGSATSGAFGQLPLTGYSGTGAVVAANFVTLTAAEAIPIFPSAAGQNSVVTFSVTNNTNPALVTATVSASSLNLVLAPGAFGIADVTVTATDTHGNAVQDTFQINVSAGTPEITLEQPAGSDIADGGSRAFPLVNTGSSSSLVFTVKTASNGNVTLSGTPRVAVDGADAVMFSVTSQPAATVIGSGGSTTFTVRFAPTSSGAKTAALHIANDDSDENPFDINLTGTGNARPTLTLPASPVLAVPNLPGGIAVTYSVTANDAEDGPLIPTVTPPSGSLFGLGDTTVSVSATDSLGARTTGSFTVRVAYPRPASPVASVVASSLESTPLAGVGEPLEGAKFSAFGPPAIGDFRTMAVRAVMLKGRTPLVGILVENAAGARTLPAYQGGSAPGISPDTVKYAVFREPLIAPDGSIAFLATLQGGGVRATEDFGVWTDAFGSSLELVLREGHDVPGLPANAKLAAVPSLSLRNGALLALLTLSPYPSVVSVANDQVLLRMTGAATATVLLREGRELSGVPGSGPKVVSFSVLSPALGSPGQGRWQADGDTVAKVVLTDGSVRLVKIASDGTATSLLSNADFATPVNPLAKWAGFGLPAMGSEGTGFVVAAALRAGVGGVGLANDFALLFNPDGTEWRVFARENDAAPVTPAGPRYAILRDPLVNASGQIAFIASLQGTGTTPSNRAGIFAGSPDSPTLIARLGDHPPDENGGSPPTSAVWTAFTTIALPSGLDAGVIFLAETTGVTIPGKKLALFGVDSHGTLRRLLSTGDSLTAGGSPITGMTLLGAVPGAFGATRSFNATGSIAVLATFADKTQSLLRVDIP